MKPICKTVLLIACITGGVLFSSPGSAQPAPELLSDAPSPLKAAAHKAALRSRPVFLNRELLNGLKGAGPHRLSLTLFHDRQYDVVLRRASHIGAKYQVFVGEVENLSPSYVSIAVVDDVANIEVHTPDKESCRVSWQPGGTYTVNELNPAAMGECGGEMEAPAGGQDMAEPSNKNHAGLAPVSGQTYMDVLALYTPAARDAAGGRSALVSAILSRWTYANQAHLNSGSLLQMRLADIVELNVSEAGQDIGTLYNYIQTDSHVNALRNEYGADLAHLFVNVQGSGTNAGVVGSAGRPGVYGVTKWSASDAVFAHETGHNIGCRHQLARDPDGDYEHGYEITHTWSAIETWTRHTVMWGSTTDQIPVFSDPDNYTRFYHFILGFSPPLAVGDARANNSRYIREQRMTKAGHRQPKFWMEPGVTAGDASAAAPTGSLSEVLTQWLPATGAAATNTSEIRMIAGNYSPMRITQNVRLMKWYGNGNVRIGH